MAFSTAGVNAAPWLGPPIVEVPAGQFLMGSTPGEREAAYALDEAAYGHARTRQARWYENEPPLHEQVIRSRPSPHFSLLLAARSFMSVLTAIASTPRLANSSSLGSISRR
jgi:hypothetical protein